MTPAGSRLASAPPAPRRAQLVRRQRSGRRRRHPSRRAEVPRPDFRERRRFVGARAGRTRPLVAPDPSRLPARGAQGPRHFNRLGGYLGPLLIVGPRGALRPLVKVRSSRGLLPLSSFQTQKTFYKRESGSGPDAAPAASGGGERREERAADRRRHREGPRLESPLAPMRRGVQPAGAGAGRRNRTPPGLARPGPARGPAPPASRGPAPSRGERVVEPETTRRKSGEARKVRREEGGGRERRRREEERRGASQRARGWATASERTN